ncbi:MAG: hypothetical protein IJ230_06165 [Clostridia bacterium]|nr:hypothetical protein [Clostridia bacterium]
MIGWGLIIIGSIAGIVFTGFWKKSEQGSKQKLAFGLGAYIGFALYILGIINQFEPVLSQIKPNVFTGLTLVPIIMFAIIFFDVKNSKTK